MVDNNTYEFNANNPDLVNPNIVTNNELKQLAKNYKKMENKKRFNSQSLLLKPTVPKANNLYRLYLNSLRIIMIIILIISHFCHLDGSGVLIHQKRFHLHSDHEQCLM